MIRLLKYDAVDFNQYNRCIAQSQQKNVYASKQVLDAFGTHSWEFLILNDYEAVMPVFISRKLGVRFVTVPLGIQQLGIFSEVDDPDINDRFYQHLTKNFNVLYHAFNEKNQFSASALKRLNNFVMPKQPYAEAKSKYSVHRRRNARLLPAMQCRSTMVEESNIETFEAFFHQFSKGLNYRQRTQLFQTYRLFNQSGILRKFALQIDGQLASTAFLLEDDETLSAISLLNDPAYQKFNSASILIDQIFQRCIEEKEFSFMGSNIPAVADFFSRFGAELRQYPVIRNTKTDVLRHILS